MAEEVGFVDVSLRDGVTSLWAGRLSTGSMLALLPDLDAAGYDSAEFFCGSKLTVLARDHNENPWDWIRLGLPLAKRTTLLMHGSLRPTFRWQPRVIKELYAKKNAEYGFTMTRMSEPWNDPVEMGAQMAELAQYGIQSVVNVIYSVSPRHTPEYYAERTRQMAELRPHRICIKDVGGLLTPETTRQLVPIVLGAARTVPVEFHSHANNGCAPLNCLVAAQEGIRLIHCAIPPLANGTSHTSIFSLAKNLSALGFEPAIDLEPIRRVSDHLHHVALVENFPVGAPQEYDHSVYRHQIPGGMMSHLAKQLAELGFEDKYQQILEETALVRAELGYPMMLTPLSQFVGTQAVANVVAGERYTVVSDEVIRYALGQYGREAIQVMDQDVRDKILNRPRAREVERVEQHEEPTLAEVRQKFGRSLSDEELITCFYAGEWASKAFADEGRRRYATSYESYSVLHDPLGTLLTMAACGARRSKVHVSFGGVEVAMARRPQ